MQIGPYSIEEEIGRGGMGIVYRARAAAGAPVAIKLLKKVEPERLARFDRERRLVAGFAEADGFVPLIDAGVSPAGPYIVMPLVAGGTLRDRLARGPLDVAEAVALGQKLAAALGRAHERGVVHRDLKPENVLFTEEGEPLVADLGLAKHFDRSAPGASQSISLSVTGAIRGTAGYMAPEQMHDAKGVGPEADVFALGAILYECLAWRPAFQGESTIEVVQKVLAGQHEPLRRVRRKVPPPLARTIERAIARDPTARFRDGEALRAALAVPLPARRRGPAVLALALLLAALAGVATFIHRRRPTATPTVARPPAPSAEALLAKIDERLRADDADGALVLCGEVLALAPADARAWARRARAKGKKADWDGAIADATKAIELDASNEAGWANRGWARDRKGDAVGGIADLTKAIELDPKDAWAWSSRAAAKENTGDLKGVIADASKAIELAPGDASSWAIRGWARAARGDWKSAIADDSKAIELDATDPVYWANRGWAKVGGGAADGAIEDASKAIELDEKNAFAWTTRGWAKSNKADWSGAIEDDSRAIELDPKNAQAWANRGSAKLGKRDEDGAIADYEMALKLAPDDPNVQRSLEMAKLFKSQKR